MEPGSWVSEDTRRYDDEGKIDVELGFVLFTSLTKLGKGDAY
jgi:hypothetical protein